MQILSIRKEFELFECKFELFERDLTHWKANSNHSKGIRHIQKQRNSKHLNTKFEPVTSNLNNHSKGIQSIRMQIRTIGAKFQAFECEF